MVAVSVHPKSAIIVPDSVRAAADRLFCGSASETTASDHLNVEKSLKRAQLLGRYESLGNKKLLEIGSGFGTNLALWINSFQVDGYGVEPDGFATSFSSSRELFIANGIDPERIFPAKGENLPFEDASFEIVYSANVLEHTENPLKVLEEAVRVLRPGGILHFEMPNFLSYFEGHYMVLQPPILWRSLLPRWVRLLGRDPSFARTIRTEINPVWCRRAVRQLSKKYPVKLLSLGDEIFLDRLAQPFHFETESTARKLQTVIAIVQRLNVGNWIGRTIVAAQGYYPIYLTLRRETVTEHQVIGLAAQTVYSVYTGNSERPRSAAT
jgi:SAM-dependent methyltransferase